MDKTVNKKDDCIRLASKSHPGRFYLFNKATGETQWLPFKETVDKKRDSPPKLSINKVSKTPAQDRLKRLQHTLKTCPTKVSHNTRSTSAVKPKTSREQENESKDGPSTSSTAKSFAKSPKKETKKTKIASLSKETDNSIIRVKSSATDIPQKIINLPDSPIENASNTVSNKYVIKRTATEICHSSKDPTSTANVQNMAGTTSSKFNNFRTGIVKKIKEICKIPFNMSKSTDEKLSSKDEKSSSVIKTTNFKVNSKNKDKLSLLTSATREAIITQFKEETLKSPEKTLNTVRLNTPTSRNIPPYPRGSANSRLERLKQSLLSQQQSCSTINKSDTPNIVRNLSNKTNKNITALLNREDSKYTCGNYSINSSKDTANSTIYDEVEAMDWQSIDKDETPIEKLSPEPTLVVEKSEKFLLNKNKEDENETMGDIIDTVNENLLRFSAEKQKDSNKNDKRWRKDFYYFIVDTNVLLRDLTFVEDLTKMKLCDTKGSILYIPYSVLQELDKLKMRSGFQEGVKTLAVRAIKYLNFKFENTSPHVQAQSALDERHHLVDINSADDSIMNCCLQAKQHVPNLLLLTEDVNLRNKAICNNILVSTKAELVRKRYDSSDRT